MTAATTEAGTMEIMSWTTSVLNFTDDYEAPVTVLGLAAYVILVFKAYAVLTTRLSFARRCPATLPRTSHDIDTDDEFSDDHNDDDERFNQGLDLALCIARFLNFCAIWSGLGWWDGDLTLAKFSTIVIVAAPGSAVVSLISNVLQTPTAWRVNEAMMAELKGGVAAAKARWVASDDSNDFHFAAEAQSGCGGCEKVVNWTSYGLFCRCVSSMDKPVVA